MLTSYYVRCPHVGCDWCGSLLPQNEPEAWRFAKPVASAVAFVCPRCGSEWSARVVGDDVVPLARQEAVVISR